MLRNFKRALFHDYYRSTIYSWVREIRGVTAKESVTQESIAGGRECRFQYGIKQTPDKIAETVDPSRRVASFFGHPRRVFEEAESEAGSDADPVPADSSSRGLAKRPTLAQGTVAAVRPRFDDVEYDESPAVYEGGEEPTREDILDPAPDEGAALGQFKPLPQPIPAATRKPREFLQTYTLTTLVNDSELLRNMVDLGVNLSKFDGLHNVADWLVKLDWTKDVKPRVRFLTETGGVPLEKLGEFVTANPWILQQSLDDLNVRVQYLASKKFSQESIHRIVNKAVYWLNFHVKTIDKRLGFLQRTFRLSGDEVRFVITHSPKLVTLGTGYTELLMFSFKEEMGFNEEEMRQLIIKDPRLYLTPRPMLVKAFHCLHNEMKFSHKTILSWPSVLRARLHHLRKRHEYLKSVGRDQYDSEKPNFVPLQALSAINDIEFATKVAKTSISEYNRFLKKV